MSNLPHKTYTESSRARPRLEHLRVLDDEMSQLLPEATAIGGIEKAARNLKTDVEVALEEAEGFEPIN